MGFESAKHVEQVLREIHAREYLLPAIQREFVWNTDDIVKLFDSLLRGYPVGSFLFWKVDAVTAKDYVFYNFLTNFHERDDPYAVRATVPAGSGTTAVLDGQQRLTALNIGLYGSHATRRRYGRSSNAQAYPKKRLYLNLVDAPPDDEVGLKYDLRFLTDDEARPTPIGHETDPPDRWFPVGDVFALTEDPVAYIDVVSDRAIPDIREGARRLSALYTAVRKTPSMNYYLIGEKERTPDEVLEIFIRVNQGGEKLTNSDLLLSMATNQWSTEPGAREEVRNLTAELNTRGFNFDKDFVLKTALTLVGADVRFKVETITHQNITKVENGWSRVSTTLLRTVDLLRLSGFSRESLTANNAAIPIAYYLHQRGASDSFLESTAKADERAVIIRWLTRTLLKQGVWGSGPDTLLTRLRATIDRELPNPGFPTAALDAEFASLGKALTFDNAEIDGLLELSYGARGTFATLAILYPGLDFSKEFHEDHIWPKSLFTRRRLEDAGVPPDQVEHFLDRVNALPNLQLLEGRVNQEKLAKLPAAWIETHPEVRREPYLRENDLDGIDLGLTNFLVGFEARRARMRARLVHALGVNAIPSVKAT
ncbi:DUF262 domain-containing protein [Plantibacter sp. MCCC 1A11337]|uniref:DUF262 domain-containing protein n=1 Tax=Plantibacter sp. MCCC 1A11337 TaxID=2736644 RepID=UPI0015832529|nr:DUF262 domain-containing protein [Plantibacter sp. MCCC 1A11337]NUJ88813.1 DUF262 domain-containing protein [Plantibacter sp. MCCC 1A11337]